MFNIILIIGLIAILVWASIIDFYDMIVPDLANLAVAFLGIVRIVAFEKINFLDASFGVILGGGLLLCVRESFRIFRQSDALGLGDVKLLASAGIWVGWAGIGPVLLIGSLSAFFAFVFRAIRIGRPSFKDPMPFGPFLAFGIIDVVVFFETLNWQVF